MHLDDRVMTNEGTGTLVASGLSRLSFDEEGSLLEAKTILVVELDNGDTRPLSSVTEVLSSKGRGKWLLRF